MKTSLFLASLAICSFVTAQHDTSAKLDKPALHPNLDYLEDGLESALQETSFSKDEWDGSWIPQDCKDIAAREKKNVADFKTYNVKYADCPDAWVFCYHKDSEITIDSIARQFGKLPLQMRSWVKHVVTIPASATSAYELNGNIVFFHSRDTMMTVIVHETGHSLDLNGAYGSQLSSSDNWWDNYNQDSHVPDPYAQTNALEDVAQNTVVATYDVNVPGGFSSVESGFAKIFHQYATVITWARNAGVGDSIIKPVKNPQCTHRIVPSAPVPKSGSSSRMRRDLGAIPATGLSSGVQEIQIKRDRKHLEPQQCKFHYEN